MGTNKRYADHYDRLMSDRIAEVVARGAQPDTLTDAELDLENEPLTRTPKARPVKVWVRYGSAPLLVDAELVAWTSRAAAVRWKVGDAQHKAWVWGSAVSDPPTA